MLYHAAQLLEGSFMSFVAPKRIRGERPSKEERQRARAGADGSGRTSAGRSPRAAAFARQIRCVKRRPIPIKRAASAARFYFGGCDRDNGTPKRCASIMKARVICTTSLRQ